MTKAKKSHTASKPAGADKAPAAAPPEAEPSAVEPERIHTRPLGETQAQAGESPAIEAPAPPAEAPPGTLEEAQAQLAEARALVDEYLDGWQRSRAEFANYKKRVERDLEQSRSTVTAELLTRYLPIVDDIERALRERPSVDGAQAWAEGIELIHRKLLVLLEAEGVERIQAEGQTFDPNVHEAISFEENDGVEHGKVIDVIRQGYRLGERVLRPAMVRVAR